MKRRDVLSTLAVTAAAVMGAPIAGAGRAEAEDTQLAGTLTAGLRDAMLGLGQPVPDEPLDRLAVGLRRATAEFDAGAYSLFSQHLPRLVSVGHQTAGSSDQLRILASCGTRA